MFKLAGKRLFILFFLFAAFGFKTSLAQKYNFTNFRVSNGLPINHILALKQATNGKLWIGTTNGLCVYDGASFEKFPNNLILDNNPITSIVQDKNGLMWVGTKYKGIANFDGLKFTFFNVKNNLPSNNINSLTIDTTGNVWIATDNGVSYWDGKKFNNLSKINGLLTDTILKVDGDKKGGVWFSSYKGLSYYMNGKITNYTVNNGLPANLIYTTFIDATNQLWFSTYACLTKFDGKKFTNYTVEGQLHSNRISTIIEDYSGQLWVGSFGDGFGVFKAGKFSMIDNSEGLANNVVNAMIDGREGNIWLATTNGLSKYSGNRFITYSTDEGLTSNNILSIYISDENQIWIGSNSGDLNCLSKNEFTIYKDKLFAFNTAIWNIAKDDKGQLWLATSNGAICYNEEKKVFSKPFSEVANQIVYSIFQASNGDLYFATDKGLVVINENQKKIIGRTDGLLNERVRVVHQDINGTIWIGTIQGIYCLKNNKISNFSAANKLPVAPITNIIEDTVAKRLIIATYGFGLITVSTNDKENKSEIINSANGLSTNAILFCLLDKHRQLWLGSTKNIDSFDWDSYLNTGKLTLKQYDKSIGFYGDGGNVAATDRDSNVWFGTVNGLIKHNSKALAGLTISPLISITKMQLFLSDVNWKSRNDSLDKETGLPTRLVLNYNENHISFTYQGIYLTAPEELKYSCMLTGLDKDWLPLTSRNESYYPNLSPGEYIFKVKATVNGINWSEPTLFFFEIKPPWWQTIWAYVFYVISGSTLLYTAFYLRTRNLENSRNLLSQKVIERTHDLNIINKELSKISLVANETDNAVLIFDENLELEYANSGFSKMTGYAISEIVEIRGKSLKTITFNADIAQVLSDAIREKRSMIYESPMQRKDGNWIWASTTLTPIFNASGQLKNIVVIDTDITGMKNIEKQLKESLDEKGLLLREIHHRVKNNLQIIISLFNLQSNYITDLNALKALREGQNRIKSMALIHERFYQSAGLSKIDFDGYIRRLAESLFMSYNITEDKIKLRIDTEKVALDIDTAVPCGLIINELISNSLKYAFNDKPIGEVYIQFKMLAKGFGSLAIGDNGKGLKPDFDIENSDTLGMELVQALTDQLDGKLTIKNENGLHFVIEFKIQNTKG